MFQGEGQEEHDLRCPLVSQVEEKLAGKMFRKGTLICISVGEHPPPHLSIFRLECQKLS